MVREFFLERGLTGGAVNLSRRLRDILKKVAGGCEFMWGGVGLAVKWT